MVKTIIIYRCDTLDGFFSAALCSLTGIGDNLLVPVTYDTRNKVLAHVLKTISFKKGYSRLFLAGFSFAEDKMVQLALYLAAQQISFYWFDHHENCLQLDENPIINKINGIRSKESCSCKLVLNSELFQTLCVLPHYIQSEIKHTSVDKLINIVNDFEAGNFDKVDCHNEIPFIFNCGFMYDKRVPEFMVQRADKFIRSVNFHATEDFINEGPFKPLMSLGRVMASDMVHRAKEDYRKRACEGIYDKARYCIIRQEGITTNVMSQMAFADGFDIFIHYHSDKNKNIKLNLVSGNHAVNVAAIAEKFGGSGYWYEASATMELEKFFDVFLPIDN